METLYTINQRHVFSGITKLLYLMEKLESNQYSAAFAASGAWRGTSHKRLYAQLGWEPLSLCRWGRGLTLLYKFVNNHTPDYKRDPILPIEQNPCSLFKLIFLAMTIKDLSFEASFYPHIWKNGNPSSLKCTICFRF